MTDRICSIENCDRAPVARGWCLKHYKREWKLGGLTRATPEERLHAGLIIMPSGCIEWSKTTTPAGYGNIWADGKAHLTHRLAWELEHGPIPDGLNVLHRCDNPPCCNVEHLFLGTQVENMADMVSKQRHMNNRRTHCTNGHEFTPENTATDRRGNRRCIECRRAYHRNYNRAHYVKRPRRA